MADAETEKLPTGSRLWRALYEIVRATTGKRLQVRVRFLDVTAFGGDFEASSVAARRIVPPVFDLVEHAPGRTLVTVLGLEYRSVDRLSPYDELSVSLPVKYRGVAEEHARGRFVFQMPVTTEEARWGGVELYGFPKIVANVRATREGDTRMCKLSVEGRHVLTLRAHENLVSHEHERFRLFTIRDDERVVESFFDLDGDVARSDVPGGATLELGDHPIADQLRRLDIATSSLTHLVVPRALGELSKGHVIGRVPREARVAHRAPEPLAVG